LEKIKYKNMKNKFSITLPTLWKSEYIFDMLKKYDESEYVKEILLVDNAYDPTRDLSHIKKLIHIQEPHNTYVIPAYNKLVKNSTTDLIVLSSDDIDFDVDSYLYILNEIQNQIGFENAGIIGAHSDNFEENVEIDPAIESYDPSNNRTGWGVLIAFHKSTWMPIPEQFKIWYADNWMQMVMPNKIFQMRRFPIKTKMSTTSASPEFQAIIDKDTEEWHKLLNKIQNCIRLKLPVEIY
jgi:hypothetical protein